MTGNELLARALALYSETDTSDEDVRTLAVPSINMVLAEVFDVNNRIRRFNGKDELTAIPEIESLDQNIECEDKLLRLAMPYGLAALLYFEEGDNPRLSMFKEEYANRVSQCDRWVVAF